MNIPMTYPHERPSNFYQFRAQHRPAVSECHRTKVTDLVAHVSAPWQRAEPALKEGSHESWGEPAGWPIDADFMENPIKSG